MRRYNLFLVDFQKKRTEKSGVKELLEEIMSENFIK